MNPATLQTIGLLVLSNIFMNFAWYAHLKDMKGKHWLLAVLFSWGIALAEYLLMVPANRIGHDAGLGLPQLKVMQEAITLAVFVPVCVLYLKQPIKLDYLWAGCCLMGAVYFVFRGQETVTA